MEVSALEINPRFIRAINLSIQGSKSGQSLAIRKVAEAPLAEGLIKDGRLTNSDNFCQTLKQFLRANHFSNSHWIVSLSEGAIYTAYKVFPSLNAEDLAEAVEINVATLLPGKPEEIFWGWQEIESVEKTAGQEVQIASIAKKDLEAYLLAFDKIGLIPIAIEPKSCSIGRAFGKTGNILILNLEGDVLTSVVINKGAARFAREVQITGQGEEQVKNLIAETRRTMNYYLVEQGQGQIEMAILDGSGAKPEIAHRLNQAFKMQVQCTVDVFQISGFKISSLPLIGAGIRALADPSQDVSLSLLPVGTKEAAEEKRTLLFYGGLANIMVITCFLFLLLFFGSWGLMSYLDKTVSAQLKMLASAGRTQETGTSDIQAKIDGLKPYLEEEAKIEGQMTYWSAILKSLAQIIPQGVALSQLNYPGTGEIVTIVGTAESPGALGSFRDSLSSQSFAKSVQMPSSNFSKTQIINFTISLTINQEALKRE